MQGRRNNFPTGELGGLTSDLNWGGEVKRLRDPAPRLRRSQISKTPEIYWCQKKQ